MANEETRYLATIRIKELSTHGEEINTTVKAKGLDELKRKVVGVVDLIDGEDFE